MKLSDLVTLSGYRLDDIKIPYLWEDPEIIQFLNDAQNEICEKCGVLRDSTTTSICQITVTAILGSVYTIDNRIIKLLSVKIGTTKTPLIITTKNNLDMDYGENWESATGTPTHYIMESGTQIRLYPVPTASTTLYLDVTRYPLAQLSAADDLPEISWKYHSKLIDGVMYYAYMKGDTETESMSRMKIYQQIWMNDIQEIHQSESNFYYMPQVLSPSYGNI